MDRSAVHQLLARRFGERVPRLPEARRAGARRAAAASSSATPAQRQVFVLTNARAQGLHPEGHRSVVRPDLGADRGRRAGRDSRHRQHADRVDHRSTPRARRAAGGRRTARPDPPHDLARGAEHRHARPGARLRARRDQSVLHPADRAARHRRHAARLRVSGRDRRCALVPTILGAAFIAAIWPAESAVHGSLVEALEYE